MLCHICLENMWSNSKIRLLYIRTCWSPDLVKFLVTQSAYEYTQLPQVHPAGLWQELWGLPDQHNGVHADSTATQAQSPALSHR